jgi:uridine kinase
MTKEFPIASPRLVAIVGGSGAGKSWLAAELQSKLGKEALRLSQDDFYRDLSHLSPARRARVNFNHPRAVDWLAFGRVLAQCKAGWTMEVPRYDFNTHTRASCFKRWKPRPFVLVEGLWLLRRPTLRRLFALRVFVECPYDLRLCRRIRRDQAERGRTERSVRRQFAGQVAPMHERFVAPQARWADVVLRSPVNRKEIEQLVQRIRGLLAPPLLIPGIL